MKWFRVGWKFYGNNDYSWYKVKAWDESDAICYCASEIGDSHMIQWTAEGIV